MFGTFLVVQWLRVHAPNAGGQGLIPGQGTKIPHPSTCILGFPGGSEGKESACSVGHEGSIPGLGRSPEEGNGYPLQYSCLGNSMDAGAWQATVHGVPKS